MSPIRKRYLMSPIRSFLNIVNVNMLTSLTCEYTYIVDLLLLFESRDPCWWWFALAFRMSHMIPKHFQTLRFLDLVLVLNVLNMAQKIL